MTRLLRPATVAGIAHVMSNLWARGQDELRHLGHTPTTAQELMIDLVSRGAPTWEIRTTRPVAVMGDIDGWTWFQATEDFCNNVFGVTKCVRRALREHGREMQIKSLCLHNETAGWFYTLGFAPVAKDGRFTIFRRV